MQAIPSKLKIQQDYKDQLMENTEKVLLSIHQVHHQASIFNRREGVRQCRRVFCDVVWINGGGLEDLRGFGPSEAELHPHQLVRTLLANSQRFFLWGLQVSFDCLLT